MAFPDSEFVRQGHFSAVAEIGRGAQTIVYRADYPRVGTVAIKSAPPGAPDVAQISQRLDKEWQILQRISHPNIVGAHRLLTDPQTREHYLICTYVAGGSLAAALDALGPDVPMAQDEALGYALDLCAALEELERQGVVHRDIKPSNVLRAEPRPGQFVALLADFGVAQDQQGQLTTVRTGIFFSGTPAYMAPEQSSPAFPLDSRADSYALGILLWELLTGRHDYKQLARAGKADPRRFNRQTSAGVAAVIAKATQEDPARRYQTPAALAADLRLVREGRRPKGAALRQRRSLVIGAVSTALIMVMLLAVTVLSFGIGPTPDLIIAAAPDATTTPTTIPSPEPSMTPVPTVDLRATASVQQTATALALSDDRQARAREASRIAREAASQARQSPSIEAAAAADAAAADARAAAQAAREAGADGAAIDADSAADAASAAATEARQAITDREAARVQAERAARQSAQQARDAAGAARQNPEAESASAAERAAQAASQAAQAARDVGATDAASDADAAAADSSAAAAEARQALADRQAALEQADAAARQAAKDARSAANAARTNSSADTAAAAERAAQSATDAAQNAREIGAVDAANDADAAAAEAAQAGSNARAFVRQQQEQQAQRSAAAQAANEAGQQAVQAGERANQSPTIANAEAAERAAHQARQAAQQARSSSATPQADYADQAATFAEQAAAYARNVVAQAEENALATRLILLQGEMYIEDDETFSSNERGTFPVVQKVVVHPGSPSATARDIQCVGGEVRVEVYYTFRLQADHRTVNVDVSLLLFEGKSCSTDKLRKRSDFTLQIGTNGSAIYDQELRADAGDYTHVKFVAENRQH